MRTRIWGVIAFLALLSGCGGLNARLGHVGQFPPASRADSDEFTADELNQVNFDVPIQINKQVKAYLVYFSTERKGVVQRQLARSPRYLPMIKETFQEYGLPEDLAYLAMVESGFNPKACSPAGAKGMWQFIKGTGRRYGLVINRQVDERLDPEKSTRAAARYLRDLYKQFGSWYLAAASYNCGEKRVQQELSKSDHKNFWELSANKCLPNETKNYVPQMIAATIIAKNPEKFGFKNPSNLQSPTTEKLELAASNKDIVPAGGRNFDGASLIAPPPQNNGLSYSPSGSKSSVQACIARKPRSQAKQNRETDEEVTDTATYAGVERSSSPCVASLFGHPSPAPSKGIASKPKSNCRITKSSKKKNPTRAITRKSKKQRHVILGKKRGKPKDTKARAGKKSSPCKNNRKLAKTRPKTFLVSRAR
jgi:hypothetical protein